MEKNLQYYMSLPYRIEIIPDPVDGGFAFSYPELPGCISCANTLKDGYNMLEDAKKCWLEACLEDGAPIPEPAKLEDYSGQFKLRIPKSLHMRLAQRSASEGISMNQLCLYLLSKGLQY